MSASFRHLLPTMLSSILMSACADLPREVATDQLSASTAGCTLLIDALQQARARPQVAQFLVDAADELLDSAPVTYRSGDIVFEGEFGAYADHRLEPGRDPLAAALQSELAAGRARCAIEGHDSYRGMNVTRIRFVHPQIADRHNPVTLLVEDATRLPAYHTYRDIDGRGFRWTYGALPQAELPSALRSMLPEADT